uniref:Uncharacterized protein n=1 Tax=Vitis vinifera TaxID=29760 RepID=A5APE6_VITVI|nr:hypothetical protein VITISV_023600 [Vitis vinifera]
MRLGIHNLSLLPPGALEPARPLRATPIADPDHFMSRHILITLFCDSSLSCGIHTAYSRALDFYQSMTTRGVPTLILSPAAIVERASLLTNGIREVPPAPSTSAPSEPVPEAASYDAPPAVPPTSEPPITIPGAEHRDLLASFQTLTTTQTAIMERMDHFQLRQDQQTLILREIQQHLGLLPPAPPVAVPSSVPAEDPSYPPEEPTT